MISVVGTLVADVIIRPVRGWPGKSQNATVDCIEVLPGGAVANTGMALARLGVPVVSLGCRGRRQSRNGGQRFRYSMGGSRFRLGNTVEPDHGQRRGRLRRWGSIFYQRSGRL